MCVYMCIYICIYSCERTSDTPYRDNRHTSGRIREQTLLTDKLPKNGLVMQLFVLGTNRILYGLISLWQ